MWTTFEANHRLWISRRSSLTKKRSSASHGGVGSVIEIGLDGVIGFEVVIAWWNLSRTSDGVESSS